MPTLTAPTSDDIVERFPELAGNEDQIDALLLEAPIILGNGWDQDIYTLAVKYWVAFMVTNGDVASSGGAVASESFGGISTSYALNKSEGSIYNGNEYGKMLLLLWGRMNGGASIVVVI